MSLLKSIKYRRLVNKLSDDERHLSQIPMNHQNTHITAYWSGYTEEGHSFPLNQVSNDVDNIPIAFIAPAKDPSNESTLATTWTFDANFVYTRTQIRQWIQEINDRQCGQRVMFSLMDTPTIHWYPNVDIDQFAKNIAASCDEWGLGGIDVDAESGMKNPEENYVKTYVLLIKSLRKYMSSDKVISYTCFTESTYDSAIIGQCKDDIDYINTMAYWLTTPEQISLLKHYAKDIGDINKVGIGVKAGTTPLHVVRECAQWLRDNEIIDQKRMMLWSLTRDIEVITKRKDGRYEKVIQENIVPSKRRKASCLLLPRRLKSVLRRIICRSNQTDPSKTAGNGSKFVTKGLN